MSMSDFPDPEEEMLKLLQQLNMTMAGMQQVLGQLAKSMQYWGRPKRVVRGPDGRVAGIE